VANVNIVPTAGTDGIPYCIGVPLTSTEADLGDGAKVVSPVPVVYGQTVVAVVQLSINGLVVGNTTYLVLQCDLGTAGAPVWVDAAWLVWTGTQGSATFVLCAGGVGTMNNAFQQSRNAGSPPTPQANGSNAMPIGGRFRFVGKSTFVGGSSSLAGITTAVLVTITYRIQEPR
jgi:hypothetical protein